MAGRLHRMAMNRPPRNGNARRGGRVVGGGSATVAFLALGMTCLSTAPRAHADLDDLIFQPLIDAIDQAVNVVDPGLGSSFDPGFDVDSLAAPALAAAAENASIPLQMNGTAPVVDLAIGSGPNIPVLADTGSEGLVVPWYAVGLQNLFNLGAPIGSGIASYGGSPADPNIDMFYLEYPETVNFGDGIVTAPTTVDLELFAFPASLSHLLNFNAWSLEAYLASAHADGILGVGADGIGPGPSSVITALPGDLNEGVLINETAGYLEFGPNPLPVYTSVLGAPISNLEVSVGGGGTVPVQAAIDSGGVYGTMPLSILTSGQLGHELSAGTAISVYTGDGQFLYSYTTNSTDGPIISSDNTMNTGYAPFQAYPVYISYSPNGVGTTAFDY